MLERVTNVMLRTVVSSFGNVLPIPHCPSAHLTTWLSIFTWPFIHLPIHLAVLLLWADQPRKRNLYLSTLWLRSCDTMWRLFRLVNVIKRLIAPINDSSKIDHQRLPVLYRSRTHVLSLAVEATVQQNIPSQFYFNLIFHAPQIAHCEN